MLRKRLFDKAFELCQMELSATLQGKKPLAIGGEKQPKEKQVFISFFPAITIFVF